VNDEPYELAAILATGDPHELYSGLSVLVSIAVDQKPCAALASFGALELLLGGDVGGTDKFARSLAELRDTALDLESLTIWACAASVDTMDVDPGPRLAGVMSTPRFLRETAGARRFIHV
jgi:hypothetical protein